MSLSVVVIGAGLGGLAAAIELAASGAAVQVIEAQARPGGKAGVQTVDGVEFDTGPSLLTLPEIARALLERAPGGAERLRLTAPEPGFRYLWPDGVQVDVFIEPERTLADVERALGRRARDELAGFLAYAAEIWAAAAPPFMFAAAPSWRRPPGLRELASLSRIDPLRTMDQAIFARVREPHLRSLLRRYATYNGSDVRRAPATLNCIAHVELTLGGFGVQGGIFALVEALVGVAEALGVRFSYGRPARRLLTAGGRVVGVEVAGGSLAADAVVVNADPAHLVADLLPPAHRGAVRPAPEPSMSGWTGVFRAARQPGRAAHTVVFPEDYEQEFADLFDHGRAPRSPTVYASAQDVAHGRAGWPEGAPLFAMINLPPTPAGPARAAEPDPALAALARGRLQAAGLLRPDDALVWARDNFGLAADFPGSRGAIYGAASNSPMAAFSRPPNRCDGLPGLYLACGGAHPGGGMPLALQSGRLAAAALRADRPDALRPLP